VKRNILVFVLCGLLAVSVMFVIGCGPQTEVIALSVERMD